MANMRRIGILTSGGDTPGMNAAIRAVFKMGSYLGMNVMGIFHGYVGLMSGNIRQLTDRDCEAIIHKGGTILRTARSEEFRTEEGIQQAIKVIDAYQIEGVVVIGGDGSYNGAKFLSSKGVPVVCLPGTIDNDLGYSDYTIGFDTAANSVMNEIYKIRDTMRSHDRVGAIEVMGRACGDIALHAGVAGGADYILVPEETPDGYEEACDRLVAQKLQGQVSSIVLIAEGAGGAEGFCQYVSAKTNIDIRPIVLGYIQRGGQPSVFDRVNATCMGTRAVELLDDGIINRAVGLRNNEVYDLDLTEALETPKRFNKRLYDINNIMSLF